MTMDFANAQLPAMVPLSGSWAANTVEGELKALVLELWATSLASDAFDANVVGVAHLGSSTLVSRGISADGLAFPVDDGVDNPAARYLFKAWKGQNGQGRGLHFLRTYLAMLFPGAGEVRQLWQKKGEPYPTNLSHQEAPDRWLTSRVEIWINAQEASPEVVKKVTGAIRAVIPARFVPTISVVTQIYASQAAAATVTPTRAINLTASVVL